MTYFQEGPGADVCDAVGDGDGGQAGAVQESLLLYHGDTGGDGDRSNTSAFIESTPTDVGKCRLLNYVF